MIEALLAGSHGLNRDAKERILQVYAGPWGGNRTADACSGLPERGRSHPEDPCVGDSNLLGGQNGLPVIRQSPPADRPYAPPHRPACARRRDAELNNRDDDPWTGDPQL